MQISQIISTEVSQIPQCRILIVEDDLSLKPLWQKALSLLPKNTMVDWACDVATAEKLIHARFMQGEEYSLAIVDIYFDSQDTGIDLWNRYGEAVKKFVLVSSLPVTTAHLLKAVNYGSPQFYKKPLNIRTCIEIAENALQEDL